MSKPAPLSETRQAHCSASHLDSICVVTTRGELHRVPQPKRTGQCKPRLFGGERYEAPLAIWVDGSRSNPRWRRSQSADSSVSFVTAKSFSGSGSSRLTSSMAVPNWPLLAFSSFGAALVGTLVSGKQPCPHIMCVCDRALNFAAPSRIGSYTGSSWHCIYGVS